MRGWLCGLLGHRHRITVGVIDCWWCERCGEVIAQHVNEDLYA